MPGLPATGGNWAQVLEPNLNPLNVRYWQITHVLIRDYDPTGVWNCASPSVGLTTGGVWTASGLNTSLNLFTPFAANNTSIRQDLVYNASGTNQGLYDLGLCKEDSTDWTPEQTVQQTPTAQFIRTVRNVFTKLDDTFAVTPIESSPLVDALKFELPLAGGLPTLGSPQYVMARGNTDILRERVIVAIGIDSDMNLMARVFPRVATSKKGKNALGRKEPDSQEFTWDVEPDPFTGQSMYIVRAGAGWLGAGNLNFETTAPAVTPVTGLKANIVFPTPIDVTSPVYSIQLQTTPTGSFSAGTLQSTTGTVSGGFTTIQATSLTASTSYNAVVVTATGSNLTVSSMESAPFTSTAS